MKLIHLIIIVLFASSCQSKYKTKYKISTTDDSSQVIYTYHTDSLSFTNNGIVSFIPKEDSTHLYTLKHYSIER